MAIEKNFFKILLILFIIFSINCQENIPIQDKDKQPAKKKKLMTAQDRSVFLTTLEGLWDGRATLTPEGPMGYNIDFVNYGKGIKGNTDLNVSIHYWDFHIDKELLQLRFLSTFRGNKDPVWLTATKKMDNTFFFHTEKQNFLEVRVTAKKKEAFIQIFLRGKLHVEIELSKKNTTSDKSK